MATKSSLIFKNYGKRIDVIIKHKNLGLIDDEGILRTVTRHLVMKTK